MKILIRFMGVISLLALASCAQLRPRSLNADKALAHFEKNRKPIDVCVDKEVKKTGWPVGKVTLSWKVNDKGEVRKAELKENTTSSDAVGDCWLNHLKTLHFPASPTFTSVEVEFSHRYKSNQ